MRGYLDFYTGADTKIGTGSADDFYFQHDGTDSNITNITGNTYIITSQATKKTFFGNGTINKQLVIDHDTSRIGFYNDSPIYNIHGKSDSTENFSMVLERDTFAQFFANSTSQYGQVGTSNNYNFRILTNSLSRIEIDTSGNCYIPAAFAATIGGTNVDLYIDNLGKIGPSPCSVRYKENIVDAGDTSFIYSLQVRKFDYKEGPSNQVGFIAEEMQAVFPSAVRHAVFKKNGESWEQIDRTRFQNIKDAEKIPLDAETPFDLEKIPTETDLNPTTERATIKKMCNSVNLSSLIAPMLKEIQNLKAEIEALKAASLQGLIQGANVKDSAKKKAIKALGIK
jgi:hypothetical protein